MPRVGFEHTISVFERAKTVDALGRAATVIGGGNCTKENTFVSDEITRGWRKVVSG
jgi:hypothetical protein